MQSLKEVGKLLGQIKQNNQAAFAWLKYINPYTPQKYFLSKPELTHFVPIYWLSFFGFSAFGISKYKKWKKNKNMPKEQHHEVAKTNAHHQKPHH